MSLARDYIIAGLVIIATSLLMFTIPDRTAENTTQLFELRSYVGGFNIHMEAMWKNGPTPAATAVATSPQPAATTSTVPTSAPKKPRAVTASPKVTTTTVTTAPAITTIPTVLTLAQTDVGKAAEELGIQPDFWCAVYAQNILTRLGWVDDDEWDSPNRMDMLTDVTDPQPGDFVYFSFQPGTGQRDHIAVIESLEPLVVIDGNGASETHIARWTPTYEVAGYGRWNG